MLHAPKTPRWLSPELLVLAGFVATSECVAAALLGTSALSSRAVTGGLVGTAVASALLARLAVRKEPSRTSDVHAITGAIGVGAVLWGLVFALGGERASSGLAFGATIGLLPSVCAGIVLALLGRTLRSVRMFAANDALERVGLVAGGAAGLAGALAIGFVSPALIAIPLVSAGLGMALLATTWRRDVRTCAWLRDVYAGKVDGYTIVPIDEAHVHESLSPLVPGSAVDAVLLEDAAHGRGPYRGTDRPRAIALVQRDATPSLWPIRARAQRAGFFFALTVSLGSAATFAQVHRARAARTHASTDASAQAAPRIACREARAVFEYHAKETGPVARALFLTHAQDARVPESEGWLYLADAHGNLPDHDVIRRVLAGAAQIPCADPPTIAVLPHTRRAFNVEARLTFQRHEHPELVAVWVRDALRAAFEPGTASPHESVDFGFYDRKLRWRVVSTIAQTDGVRTSEVLLDGTKDDVALAPEELAGLAELVIVDAETGKTL